MKDLEFRVSIDDVEKFSIMVDKELGKKLELNEKVVLYNKEDEGMERWVVDNKRMKVPDGRIMFEMTLSKRPIF